jgi:hypothetical protein
MRDEGGGGTVDLKKCSIRVCDCLLMYEGTT